MGDGQIQVDTIFIRGMIERLVITAEKDFKLIITREEQVAAIQYVVKHYIDHCQEYSVYVSSIDPFKFLSWTGLYFYHTLKKESTKKKVYLALTVSIMLSFLKKNNKNLDIQFVQKLLKMTTHDKNEEKDHLAIGMNGLYMAFRSANMVESE